MREYDPQLEDALVQFAKGAQWLAGTHKPNLQAIREQQEKPVEPIKVRGSGMRTAARVAGAVIAIAAIYILSQVVWFLWAFAHSG